MGEFQDDQPCCAECGYGSGQHAPLCAVTVQDELRRDAALWRELRADVAVAAGTLTPEEVGHLALRLLRR